MATLFCPVRALAPGRNVEYYALCPARSQSTGRTAPRKQVTVRTLQKAFSPISSLHRQKPDRAEKLKDKGARFSREYAYHVPLSNFEVKAFRKFSATSVKGALTPSERSDARGLGSTLPSAPRGCHAVTGGWIWTTKGRRKNCVSPLWSQ